MLSKVKRLYKQTRSRMVSLCAVEVFELQENIDKLTGEERMKHMEFQSIPYLATETVMLR